MSRSVRVTPLAMIRIAYPLFAEVGLRMVRDAPSPLRWSGLLMVRISVKVPAGSRIVEFGSALLMAS